MLRNRLFFALASRSSGFGASISDAVRRVRRKWYQRLTDKCNTYNTHDRHSGIGVEAPAVYVEVEQDSQPDADLSADVSRAAARVTFGTLNMQVKNLDEGFQDILCKRDILCLQEVTPSCVEDLLQIARSHGYEVATAMGRGSVSAEPFDVCMLLMIATIRKLRMSMSSLTPESPRRLLAVQVQLRGNGAVLAIGTVHLPASQEGQPQHLAELESALCTLQALQVDGHLLVGDLNMQKDEDVTSTEESWAWNDAWHCAGQDPSNAGQTDSRVEQWRFNRLLFRTRHCWRESEMEGQEAVRISTLKLCDNSYAVGFNAAPSDHVFAQATFAVLAGRTTHCRVLEERLQVLRPGLGQHLCRRPGAREKCAQQRHGQSVCGKDYEKARMCLIDRLQLT